MSREGQTLQRNLNKEELRDDGVPLTEEQYVLYIMTERQLIGFLSQKIALIDPTLGQMDCECQAALMISHVYHDWFHEQVNVLIEERFINLYRGMHGPRNLFQALFPGQEIDDFLRSHIKKSIADFEQLEESALSAVTMAEIGRVLESSRVQEIEPLAL